MNIRTIKDRTCILMPKHHQDKLDKVFSSIIELEGMPLTWARNEGYFYVQKKLHPEVINKIKKSYKRLFENPVIIKGYHGCPITLHSFEWKI